MTRIAIVKKADCNPIKCGEICAKLCPVNRMGEDCIQIIDGKAQIDEVLCTGCGICPKRCPFDAISIINLPEELDQEPIHRYGKNGFALYNLPVPMFGKVVGVLGRNGIGKSTAIKIFAGILTPNLGKIEDEEPNIDDVIAYFKGNEAQAFFEKLKAGDIKVSYKPQAVEMIPKAFKGVVRELLSKVDEVGRMDEVVEALELNPILDNPINAVSGGELQRIAIAACVLKDANLFIFDEPTSFLDIKQRLKVGSFIRDMVKGGDKAVLLVEHDLIVLDYMTDFVHLMYGKPGVYGVATQPKTTRVGINVYLSGYLREENVRFRDHAITFEAPAPFVSQRQRHELVTWKGLSKTLGNFYLDAPEGSLYEHEMTGVLGENGLGKTTFAKVLAGEIEADLGSVGETVSLSYKPQYLQHENEPVAEFLIDAMRYENQLLGPLQIQPLMAKSLGQLSGGELQRVFIARCLSKDAELYIMDEPSAYLDVEQRLAISRVIRNFIEFKSANCLVIDHDILFIDYLSENLLVFTGTPGCKGKAEGPFDMQTGMNMFLRDLNITFRRDPESHRPRANDPESQMDRKQKSSGKLYYV